jgi:hypothetical protein
MAVGAWWYNYSQSLRAARFWGKQDAQLIVGAETVELLTLTEADESPEDTKGQRVADWAVTGRFDLSKQRGLVHLRHSLTFDANFAWDERGHKAPVDARWSRALRFAQGDHELLVLFPADFTRLGRVAADGRIEALPCPRLGPSIVAYLTRVGALGLTPAEAAAAETGAR